MNGKTLNLTEVAEHIGITRATLYQMIQDGRFPVKPIENVWPRRWNIEDVDSWRGIGKDDNN